MNPYQQRKRWKYSLLASAVVIASGSLIYTSYLVNSIKQSERTRAQVWALSIKQITASDDNDFLNYVFAVRDSLTVPAIIVDEKGDFITTKGLDSTKTYIKMPAVAGEKDKSAKKYDQSTFCRTLLGAARSPTLSAHLRRQVALAAFIRAILLNNEEAARSHQVKSFW